MSRYGITVTILATELSQALAKDAAIEGGEFDLIAGKYGPHLSDWIRGVARDFTDLIKETPTNNNQISEVKESSNET